MRPSFASAVRLAILVCALAALLLSPAEPAEAHGKNRPHMPYAMEILVDGVSLEHLRARGKTYVEALEGREYSIRFHNRTGRRVAVALSVDGLNVIDAKTTTAGQASKWIVGPWDTLTLDGWQIGPSTARRFFFTSEAQSYGAWLGKTSNLGIISAVVFRERIPAPAPINEPRLMESEERRMKRSSGKPAGPSAAPGRAGDAAGAERQESVSTDDADGDLAATGIGEKLEHRVTRVRFDSESAPAASLEVRYEYHDALVQLGVLPHHYSRRDDPLERRERASGFEGMEFSPDPYR